MRGTRAVCRRSARMHGRIPGGHRNRGLSCTAEAHEVAHSVGELLRQRRVRFRFQDTGGINDKNFRKLSPSALSSIWRTPSNEDAAVSLRRAIAARRRTTRRFAGHRGRADVRGTHRSSPQNRAVQCEPSSRHKASRIISLISRKPTSVRVRALCVV